MQIDTKQKLLAQRLYALLHNTNVSRQRRLQNCVAKLIFKMLVAIVQQMLDTRQYLLPKNLAHLKFLHCLGALMAFLC